MGSITAKTTQGKRREQEDRLVVLSCDDGYILAVCDGHNGHETASKAIARLVRISLEHPTRDSLADTAVARDFLATVIRRLTEETCSDESGSTLSLAHISEQAQRVDVAVLGDSPVVVRTDKQTFWVSPEHNVRANEGDCRYVREHEGVIQGGYLSYHQHDTRELQLTRTLGDRYFSALLQRKAEYFHFPLGRESIVVVMSDGVYDEHFLCRKEDLESLPMTTASVVVQHALLRGSRDNISAIIWRAR